MTALTRVDTATFPVFTAFLMAHSDAGTRDYLSHTDLKALFLERQGAEAWFYGDGARPQAVTHRAAVASRAACAAAAEAAPEDEN